MSQLFRVSPVATYCGREEQGLANGFGTVQNHANFYYSGAFHNDFIAGFGKLESKDGYYEGELMAGRFNGIGRLEKGERLWIGRFENNVFVEGQYRRRHANGTTVTQTGKFSGAKLVDGIYVFKSPQLEYSVNSDCFVEGRAPQRFQLISEGYVITCFGHDSVLPFQQFIQTLLCPDAPKDAKATADFYDPELVTSLQKTARQHVAASPQVQDQNAESSHFDIENQEAERRDIRSQDAKAMYLTMEPTYDVNPMKLHINENAGKGLGGTGPAMPSVDTAQKKDQSGPEERLKDALLKTNAGKPSATRIRMQIIKNYPDGSVYTGDSVNLTPDGSGRLFIFKANQVLEGHFKDGAFQTGELITQEGVQLEEGVTAGMDGLIVKTGFRELTDARFHRKEMTCKEDVKTIQPFVLQGNFALRQWAQITTWSQDLKHVQTATDDLLAEFDVDKQGRIIGRLTAQTKTGLFYVGMFEAGKLNGPAQLSGQQYRYQFQYEHGKLVSYKLQAPGCLVLCQPHLKRYLLVKDKGAELIVEGKRYLKNIDGVVFEGAVELDYGVSFNMLVELNRAKERGFKIEQHAVVKQAGQPCRLVARGAL